MEPNNCKETNPRMGGSRQRANYRRIRGKWTHQHRHENPKLRSWLEHSRTHTHISIAFNRGNMEDSFNRSPNVVGDRDTHPPIATSKTTPQKQKNVKMQHQHLPLESLPSTGKCCQGRNERTSDTYKFLGAVSGASCTNDEGMRPRVGQRQSRAGGAIILTTIVGE